MASENTMPGAMPGGGPRLRFVRLHGPRRALPLRVAHSAFPTVGGQAAPYGANRHVRHVWGSQGYHNYYRDPAPLRIVV